MTSEDSKRKRHINEFGRTSFANSGRVAGMGISEDRYNEESFPGQGNIDPRWMKKNTPVPKICDEDAEESPVITYRLSNEELKELNKKLQRRVKKL